MARSQRSWYRGDCHVHTRSSVAGELTPAQVRLEALGLDFIAITEHNRVEPAGQIDDPELDLLNDPLVIAGQEVVTGRGHWSAVGQLRSPHNVVLAETLTPQGVLAIQAGDRWLAESTSIDLIATAELTDGRRRPIGPVCRDSVPAEGSGTLHWTTRAASPEYFCIEVRHPDRRMAALSNPIFLLEASE